jgi:SAM-dependent methyltransferase
MEYAECSGSELGFWVGETRKLGFRVLEFAVGTGRIAIPLARHGGFEVAGIDSSRSMLEHARAKRSLLPSKVQRRLKFKHGLMENCRVDLVFDLAFVAFNSYLLLPDRDSRINTLLNASAHVRPGGGIAVDAFAAIHLDTKPDHEEVEFLERDLSTGLRVTRERFYSHNMNCNRGQSTLVYRFYENQMMVYERRLGYSLALVSRDDVVSEFTDAGLEIDGVYGSYDRAPWEPSSPNLIVVGRTTSVDT